jgi:hypothetical protein
MKRPSLRFAVVLVAIMALLAIGGSVVIAGHQFTDVPTSSPFHGAIDWLVDRGITAGCDTTPPRYCPKSSVTREQMAVFMNKLANVTVAAGIHVTRGASDVAVVESWFNNVNSVAPTLASSTGDGDYDINMGFNVTDSFAMCNIDTNFVDTRDALCTVSTPGGSTVRVRTHDVSAGALAPAEFWVLVYGDQM